MIIELGQVKPQLLILLIYPIGIFFAKYIGLYFVINPYYYLFIFFISHFLALIPLIYLKIRKIISQNKKKKQEDFNNLNNSKNSYNPNEANDSHEIVNQIEVLKGKIEKIKKRDKILFFFLIAFLYFVSYVFFYYFNYITQTGFYGNISMITEVFYFSLFNWFILGNKIYSHHFFSMIFISLSIIVLYIILTIDYISNTEDWNAWRDFIFPTLLNFIVYCLFCYCLVKAKFYVEKYFISAYELIFYLGLFCTILLFILEPFTFLIPCNYANMSCNEESKCLAGIIYGIKNIDSTEEIWYTLGGIITLFMTALGLWLTVKDLTPCHFLTSDSIIAFELNILFDCYNIEKKLVNNALFYIFSIITIIGCLIYNEILIINVCKLNFNTRKEIIKRQSKDFNDINCELQDYSAAQTFSYVLSEGSEFPNDNEQLGNTDTFKEGTQDDDKEINKDVEQNNKNNNNIKEADTIVDELRF